MGLCDVFFTEAPELYTPFELLHSFGLFEVYCQTRSFEIHGISVLDSSSDVHISIPLEPGFGSAYIFSCTQPHARHTDWSELIYIVRIYRSKVVDTPDSYYYTPCLVSSGITVLIS